MLQIFCTLVIMTIMSLDNFNFVFGIDDNSNDYRDVAIENDRNSDVIKSRVFS